MFLSTLRFVHGRSYRFPLSLSSLFCSSISFSTLTSTHGWPPFFIHRLKKPTPSPPSLSMEVVDLQSPAAESRLRPSSPLSDGQIPTLSSSSTLAPQCASQILNPFSGVFVTGHPSLPLSPTLLPAAVIASVNTASSMASLSTASITGQSLTDRLVEKQNEFDDNLERCFNLKGKVKIMVKTKEYDTIKYVPIEENKYYREQSIVEE